MAKQLNVNLAFSADTSKAKQQIQDLQNQLTNIINNSSSGTPLKFTKEIQEATHLAAQLKAFLEGATNINTGKLDLGKFNESLKRGQMTLGDYQVALNNLGPAGNKAFSTLASSIMQAEIPIRRSNAALAEMLVTLKNTVRWQISSSILHGFMGSIQSAYRYAQDLNESLNNIRIVTGQNTEQMARFASEANKAAKALSTTTTAYTDAALIYYQQGLNDNQVKERTDITIKMANVSRQSAEEVSDQMTAVWNNFYDGSQSLEHFADVMTRLGADTASSSDEIAQGLEKFAAIADMIGLSFDNAAAALATVTATTRQSADVVGTAFKTIFARIQGLSLGETLDDGTNLNKYSQALNAVGINIKQQNGELKDMDSILAEMGAKWNTLSKDQQVALAQTVAGVRQYNQLIALMDNFDFYQKNLSSAQNSTGTLDEQAQIYAESWEAAEKRVQAAAERIYNSLLDDEFFIGFNNVLEFTLTGIGNLIDSMGGLPGVLAVLGTTITTVFGKQITASFDNLIYNIKMSTQVGRESVEKLRNEANNLLISDFMDTDTTSGYAAANAYKEQGKAQQALIDNAKKLSEEEQKQAQYLLDQHNLLANNVIKLGEEVEQEEKKTALAERRFNINIRQATGSDKTELDNLKLVEEQIKNLIKAYYELSTIQIGGENNSLKTFFKDLENQFGAIDTWTRKESDAFKTFGQSGVEALQNLNKALKEGTLTTDVFNDVLDELVYGTEEGAVNKLTQAILNLNKAEKGTSMSSADAKKAAEDLISRFNILYNKTADLTDAQLRLKNATSSVVTFLDQAKGPIQTLGSVITNSISVMTSFAMLLTSIKGMVDTLNNTEMTFGEKFFTIFTQMAFVLPNVVSVVRNMTTLLGPTGFIGAINANKTAMALLNTEYDKNLIATLANIAAEKNMTKEKLKGIIADKLSADATTQETIATTLLTNAKMKETIATAKETAAQIASNAAKWLMQPAVLATIAVLGLATVAIYTYIQAQEADARAAEHAAEAAKSLAEASNRAKQEVTDLKSAFDKYDTALDHLNSLKEGMEGFEEATKAVNDETLALLEKYPELAKISGIVIGKAGSYQLDQSKVDDYIAKAEQKANMAQAASLTGAARASSARVKADQTQLYRETSNIMITADPTISENFDNYKYINAGKELAKNFEAWSNLSPEDFEQAIRDYGASLQLTENEQNQLVNKLSDYQDEVNNLSVKTQEAAAQMDNVSKIMAGQILGSEITEEQEKMYQETFKQVEGTEYENWIGKLTGAGISKVSGYNNAIVQELEDKISDLGLDITLDRNNTVRGTDTNRTFGVLVDGETKTMTVEEIASAIAAAEAQRQAEDTVRASGENNINSQLASQGIQLDANVSTSLANSLLERLGNVIDKGVITDLNSLLTGKSASEQSDIINKFLTESVNAAEQVDVAADSEKYDLEAENVENYANSLLDLAKASEEAGDETNGVSADLKSNAKMASQVAVANSRMNKGLISLAENFDDYRKTLKTSKQGSEEYQTALKGISDAMSDVLGLDDVELSNDFLTNTTNLDLMAQAANGSAEAVEQLRAAAAQDIIQNIELKDENLREDLIIKTQELQTLLDQTDLSIGATFNNEEALTGLNELIEKSGMTAEQVQDYFNALGYTPEVDYTEGTQMQHYQGIIPYLDVNGEPDYKPYDFEIEETVQIPTIKSLTYHGDAGKTINTNAITKANGTDGSSKKNSTKKKSDEIERYHTVNKEIESIESKMSRVSSAKDSAFGKNKIPYINKEIEALNELIEKHQEYKDEIEKNLKIDEANISKYGFIDANADGILDNWEQVMEEQLRIYNEAAKAYDSGGSEEAFQEASDKYEEFKKLVEQYEETQELWEETLTREEELEHERISKELEKITTEIDFEIEINQRDLDKLDYIVEKLNRGLHAAIEVITTLGNSVSRYENQSVVIRNGINEIKAKAAAEGRDLTDDEQRQIYDYEDQLLDINRSLFDLIDTVDNSVLEEFEKFNNEIDENIDRFNTYNEALDYYSNIITLSGRATKDSALLMSIATQKVDTSMSKLNSSYDKYLSNIKAQEDALAHLNAATSDEDKEYWQKQYDEITKAVEISHNEVLSSWEEVLQAASDKFDLSIQQTLETLKSGISEYGLDGLADRYEKATEEQERYLSNLDKEYELNKLSREIAKSIDETDNIHAKQELNKLLEEINAKQESGVQMSKYDLEIMQKQYDVEMAKLALEEARNAKSTVRLRKDNEGNFGYVYTADQDKIDDAEQNYEDKLYDLQKISEDYIKEMSDKIIQNEQDMIDALENIDKTRFNTKEEYEAEVARITKYYLDKDLYLRQELDKAVIASGKTYNDTILGQMEDATSWEQAHEDLKIKTNAATLSMGEAWQDWHTTTTEAMGAVGISADGFTTTITTDLSNIGTATTTLEGDIKTSTDNMSTYIGNLMTKVSEFRAQYISDIQDMIDMNEKWVGINNTDLTTPETKEPPKVEEEVEEDSNEKPADPGAAKQQKISHSDMVDLVVDMGQGDYSNGSARRKAVEAKYPGICNIAQGILNQAIREDDYNYRHNGSKWKSQTVERLVTAAGYDTGGYTGVWGPEGKLAFLHEKELVLNKDDTTNLLSSIDLLHNIISQIDLMAASHLIFNGLMSPSYSGGKDILEQEVHIEAHFPNATNHNEIEEAFGNLINLASQYANRK